MKSAEFSTESTFIDVLNDFLPFAVEYLQLKSVPKITLLKDPENIESPSFGCFNPKTQSTDLVINNRQPMDIMRTLAHELVHTKQREDGELDPKDGKTGSDSENEANSLAGVIMREFAQQHPEYLALSPVVCKEQTVECAGGMGAASAGPGGVAVNNRKAGTLFGGKTQKR